MKRRKITLIGGGSLEWTPKLLVDLALTDELKGSHICLHDIDEKALNLMHRLGKKIIKEAGNDSHLSSTTSLEEALEDTNYVILSISAGGLATMRYDLEIPSKTVKLIKPFKIVDDQTTTLTLDFDVQKSVKTTGNNEYYFEPTIKVIQE